MIDALAETHDDRLRYRGQTFDCRLVFFPFFFSLFFSFLFFLPFFSLKFYPRTECMLDKRFEINFQILIQHAKILISYYFISFLLRWIYLYLNSLNEFTSRDIFFFFFCTISQRWFSYFGWRMYYWEAYNTSGIQDAIKRVDPFRSNVHSRSLILRTELRTTIIFSLSFPLFFK